MSPVAAVEKGVPTLVKFFGTATARELVAQGKQADLLLGNNVLAQVPDLNDFVAGMKILLEPSGVITIEFPHLMRLMEENQFDTIYHEHFSYFLLPDGGKDLRGARLDAFRCRGAEHAWRFSANLCATCRGQVEAVSARVHELRAREESAGLTRLDRYHAFAEQVKETKRKLLEFLIEAKRAGKQIVGYGAPGKGNTLLNFCGIRTDFLDYTVDRSPHKQGKFLPGTHIPIYSPDRIRRDPARLPADSALESEGRNHETECLHPRVGRPIRGSDSNGEGVPMISILRHSDSGLLTLR